MAVAERRFEGPGWALLDRLVQWCRDAGLRVIIDLHAAPGGQTGVNHDDGPGFPLTFYVPRYRQLTIALWQKLAAHYRDETAILGYDLLNEPISPYNDVDYLNPQLEPLYRDIVAAIRGVDPKPCGAARRRAMGHEFRHVRPAVRRQRRLHLSQILDQLRRATRCRSYLDFSNRWNVPVLIGETGEYNNGWNEKFRRLHERFGIGWIFWPYKNLDSELSVVSIQKPAGWDLIAECRQPWASAALPSPSNRRKRSSMPIWKPRNFATSASTPIISRRSVSPCRSGCVASADHLWYRQS